MKTFTALALILVMSSSCKKDNRTNCWSCTHSFGNGAFANTDTCGMSQSQVDKYEHDADSLYNLKLLCIPK